ncbi:MAG TPA: DUF6585 family protein [Acidimicrobiales bacterium]
MNDPWGQPSPSEHAGAPAPPPPPPARVAKLAASRQLGPLVADRKGSNPFANALFCVVVAVAAFGLIAVIAWLELRFLRFLAILALAVSIVALIMAVMALLAGFTGAYLYANGLVRSKNGRLQVATWPEVSRLLLWRGAKLLEGKLLCYYVVTRDGRKLSIEAREVDGRDEFGEVLQAYVRHGGGDVVESGPAAGVMRP